jgi:glycosyltransferase involved in cell wall biosynthesis
MREAVECTVKEFGPVVVQVDHLGTAQYVVDIPVSLVVDAHDAISLTETRKLALDETGFQSAALHALMRYQIRKIRHYEEATARRASAYVVNAEPDREYLARYIPHEKLHVIPNGVDTDYYHPMPRARTECQLVFTGDYSYRFNADAMLYFHKYVLPRVREAMPTVTLKVVGANPPPELTALGKDDPLTTVTGFVEDVRPAIWESAVFICPLRGGTGMKNKLLISMALGKPIVATPSSADGLGVRDGEQMLLAKDDDEFADAVVRVLRDPALAARLGEMGRAHVTREFGYRRLAERFEQLYLRLARGL